MCGGVEGRIGVKRSSTHHPPRKSKQHAQRVRHEQDHPRHASSSPATTYEIRQEAKTSRYEKPDAEEDVVVGGGGGAAVDLGGDEVAGEAEDEDCEEDL